MTAEERASKHFRRKLAEEGTGKPCEGKPHAWFDQGPLGSENVYAIDHGGNLRWRIQSPPFGARSGPYMDLSIEGAVVRLQGKGGRAYRVNSKDESFIGS